jgi:hypothetical protein
MGPDCAWDSSLKAYDRMWQNSEGASFKCCPCALLQLLQLHNLDVICGSKQALHAAVVAQLQRSMI